MRMPDGAVASGEVVEVVENHSFVFTWGWTGVTFDLPPGSTTVSIALTPLENGGTRILVTHTDLPVDISGRHSEGWLASLAQLDGVLST